MEASPQCDGHFTQNKVPNFPSWSHLCVCVCVCERLHVSWVNPQTDWKRDGDWQSVKYRPFYHFPLRLVGMLTGHFNCLACFPSGDLSVCLRLKATVCTKVLPRRCFDWLFCAWNCGSGSSAIVASAHLFLRWKGTHPRRVGIPNAGGSPGL